jgi:hypothetical protein
VLDALVQLVFALCLIALWIGLPIGLVFVFFEQTAGGVTGLFRRMLGVLQVSWSSSVLLGIIAACLIAAAESAQRGGLHRLRHRRDRPDRATCCWSRLIRSRAPFARSTTASPRLPASR